MLKKSLVIAVLLVTGIVYVGGDSLRNPASREAVELSLSGPGPVVDKSEKREESFQCIDRIGECATSCPQLNKFKECREDTSACPDPELPIKLICR